MTKKNDIRQKLYNLLKEPLGLYDNCRSFTLEVDMEGLPIVIQEYVLDGQIQIQEDQLDE